MNCELLFGKEGANGTIFAVGADLEFTAT